MATQITGVVDICPRCGPHDRVYKLEDLLEDWRIGLAGHPTVAPERVASLRDALAIPKGAQKITAEQLLRYYNYAAAASRLVGLHFLGFHLPHLSKGSYGSLSAICGGFALVFFTLVGEKPAQAILTSVVFAGLAIFFFLRWRDAGRRAEEQTREQERLAQERAARWGSLLYCDQCQAIYPGASSDAIEPSAVREYVATGVAEQRR